MHINSQLWSIVAIGPALIVETNPNNHVLHTFLSCNPSFPSLSHLITPTNDGPVLMDFTFGQLEQFQNYTWRWMFQTELSPPSWVNIIVYTTLYSNVMIGIDNYLDTYQLTPDTWTQLPALIMLSSTHYATRDLLRRLGLLKQGVTIFIIT